MVRARGASTSQGGCTLVRFADDAVLAFEDFLDAKRVLGVLGKRFARYGLSLHPDKTRFVDFRNNRPDGTNHPETNGTSFTFLGFTHIWGKSRAGKNVVRQVTAKNRYARALAAVTDWCRHNRHQPIPDQHAHLTAMMRGHYAYYGITAHCLINNVTGELTVRSGTAIPNRIGVADGRTDQHGYAARDHGGGGRPLSISGAGWIRGAFSTNFAR